MVTTDFLMKDEIEEPDSEPITEWPAERKKRPFKIAGIILCCIGTAGLLFWGLLQLFQLPVTEQIAVSSAVTLNGAGFLILFCVLLLFTGVWLLLRKK